MFKCALTVCSLMEEKIEELNFEELVFTIRNCIDKIDEDLFLKKVIENKLTLEKFKNRFKKESKNLGITF